MPHPVAGGLSALVHADNHTYLNEGHQNEHTGFEIEGRNNKKPKAMLSISHELILMVLLSPSLPGRPGG